MRTQLNDEMIESNLFMQKTCQKPNKSSQQKSSYTVYSYGQKKVFFEFFASCREITEPVIFKHYVLKSQYLDIYYK